jgi:hypothetical protein
MLVVLFLKEKQPKDYSMRLVLTKDKRRMNWTLRFELSFTRQRKNGL